MALTNAQKLSCRLLLQADRGELDPYFAELTAEEETEVARILTEASSIELSATKISAEGVTIDPVEQRVLLAERLAATLNCALSQSVGIGRR